MESPGATKTGDTKTGVAVFPCASGIGQELFYALGGRRDIALFGINSGDGNAGSCLYGSGYLGGAPPMSRGGELVGFLNARFAEHDIRYVFPAYDDATVWLKRNQPLLSAAVIAPGLEAVEACRSKTATYAALASVVRTPAVFSKDLLTPSDLPVFAKPDAGEGSKRCRLVSTMREVSGLGPDEIAVEYFPGEEYTVDCFTHAPVGTSAASGTGAACTSSSTSTDTGTGWTAAFPRVRHGVRAGLSVHARPATDPSVAAECEGMARRIAAALSMRGAWFFQCRGARDGGLGLLEVAPRIPGASALTRHAGVNLPLLSLYSFMGRDVRLLPGRPETRPTDVVKVYRNNAVFRHSFDTVFCDLDDTLVKEGAVCPRTIAFLYRWRAASKRIVLLTRHRGDVGETLRRLRVAESLFDRVVRIPDPATPKSGFVTPGSVFVDDSFRERSDVSSRVPGVLCLDVDCLSSELLILDPRPAGTARSPVAPNR